MATSTPAFLFYSSDFLSGVTDLTMEERGQYITLLCLQHQKGSLNEKSIRLSVGKVSDDVLAKFSKDEKGNYTNERLKIEVEKRENFVEKQREIGKLGGRKKNPTVNPTLNPTVNPNETQPLTQNKPMGSIWVNPNETLLENENEIENEIENENKETGGVGENTENTPPKGKNVFGEHANVFLRAQEHRTLRERYTGPQLDWMIETLSTYKLANAKHYASDYAILVNGWVKDRMIEEEEKKQQKTLANATSKSNNYRSKTNNAADNRTRMESFAAATKQYLANLQPPQSCTSADAAGITQPG